MESLGSSSNEHLEKLPPDLESTESQGHEKLDISESSSTNQSSDLFSNSVFGSHQISSESEANKDIVCESTTEPEKSNELVVASPPEPILMETNEPNDNDITEEEEAEEEEGFITCLGTQNDQSSYDNPSDLNNLIEEAVHKAYIDSIRVPQEMRVIDWSQEPTRIASCQTEFSHTRNNYLRGCKWAPDSSCLLTNSDDNILRIFNFPPEFFNHDNRDPLDQEMEPVLKIHEHELIYDYSWYPLMNSNDPVSCCIASCTRSNPVNLWDAFTGKKRAAYRAFNHLDELEAPYSVAFSIDGHKLFCGFNKCIRIFDVERPGKECDVRPKLGSINGQNCLPYID